MKYFTNNFRSILIIVLAIIQSCFAVDEKRATGQVLPSVKLETLKQRIAQAASVSVSNNTKIVKGSIEINDNEDDVPEFRLYFNGMETLSSKEGFFSFPLEESLDEYMLVLTKNVHLKTEKNNTLKELRIKNSSDYRCFSLRRTGPDNAVWSWEENTIKLDDFVVPYKSVVLFVNPRCLEKLESWKVQLPDRFVPIPRIILKGEYRTWMDRQAKKSLLYSLDLKPFHEKVREEHKNIPGKSGEMILLR